MSRRRALGLVGAATAAALLGRPDPTAAARAVRTGYGVAVEPRATWAGTGRPILSTPPDEDVRFLLVHHTAGPSQGDPIDLIRQVYDFHTGSQKGWPDVAYNFFVEPGGRVLEGRAGSLDRAVEASATGGNQGFAQLVCLLGDFTSRNPTDAQLASLNQTLAWLADRYGLDTSPGATGTFTSRGSNRWPAGTSVTADVISGHREMSATACPGDTFFPYLKERVQGEVHALRGNPPAPTAETDESGSGVPDSTIEPVPANTSVESRPPTTLPESVGTTPTGGVPSTAAPRPPSTITLPTTVAPATTAPPTTVPGTVADGPVMSAPSPAADEVAGEARLGQPASDGRSSSDATAWVLGAGAAAVVLAAAVYVGVRGGGDDELPAPVGGSAPPPDGGDPLR